jgi:hypothetical protein
VKRLATRSADQIGVVISGSAGHREVTNLRVVGCLRHFFGVGDEAQGQLHVTAVARELLGFVWAIGTRAETVASQQIAA